MYITDTRHILILVVLLDYSKCLVQRDKYFCLGYDVLYNLKILNEKHEALLSRKEKFQRLLSVKEMVKRLN